jgi:NADH-quinone oxidoreductase subunit J
MSVLFYLAAVVVVAATAMAITRLHAVHALLYLIVSLLAVALVFFSLGAPFVAALEVIIYAGAIMVLFVFVVMMLNLGPAAIAQERGWLPRRAWLGPTLLGAALGAVWCRLLLQVPRDRLAGMVIVPPQAVGLTLFGPYLIGVEVAAMLLLAGLLGAYHLGRRRRPAERPAEKPDDDDSDGARAAARQPPVRAGADRPVGAP